MSSRVSRVRESFCLAFARLLKPSITEKKEEDRKGKKEREKKEY